LGDDVIASGDLTTAIQHNGVGDLNPFALKIAEELADGGGTLLYVYA